MAQKYTDDGRDTPTRASPGNGLPERERRPEVAPPGSRERSESDVTGWSPERDESHALRQGRFHRAAQMRMAQPRTEVGPPPREDDTRSMQRGPGRRHGRHAAPGEYGPYGGDDRTDSSAAGLGTGPMMGEQDLPHSLETRHPPRDYRPWDRTGYGAEEHRTVGGPYEEHRAREPRGPRYEGRGDYEPRSPRPEREWAEAPGQGLRGGTSETYSALLGMGQASPSRPASEGTGRRGRWQHEPLTAREIMTRHVKSVHRDGGLRDVARIMKEEDCGIVPVVDERGRLQGLITDRDMVLRGFAEGKDPDMLRARDVMTDEVEAVTPDEDIHGLIELMGRRQVRRVPVVERDDRLVGIVSMADIANRAHYDEELQEALDRISARRSFWTRWS